MKYTLLAAAALSFAGFQATASTVTFNNFAEGDILAAGAELSPGLFADVSATGGIARAVVFDTTAGSVSTTPVGGQGDPDLTSPFTNAEDATDSRPFGNALIVQENAGTPDDAIGGALTFEFLSDVVLSTVFLLDSKQGTFAELFLDGVSVLKLDVTAANDSDTGNNPTNNLFTELDFGGITGDTLFVQFATSGAIGELEVAAVPLPAGITLTLLGLGALGVARRKKA